MIGNTSNTSYGHGHADDNDSDDETGDIGFGGIPARFSNSGQNVLHTSDLLNELDMGGSHRSVRPLYRSVQIATPTVTDNVWREGVSRGPAPGNMFANQASFEMPTAKGGAQFEMPASCNMFEMPKVHTTAAEIERPSSTAPTLPDYPLSPNGMDVDTQDYTALLDGVKQHLNEARLLDYQIDEEIGEITGRFYSDRFCSQCTYRINIYAVPSGHKLEFQRMNGSSVAFHDFMSAAKTSLNKAVDGSPSPMPTPLLLPFDLPELDNSGDRFTLDQSALNGYAGVLSSGPQEAQEAVLSIMSQAAASSANARVMSKHALLPSILVEQCKSTAPVIVRYAAVTLKNVAQNGSRGACRENLKRCSDVITTLLQGALNSSSQESAYSILQAAEALLHHEIVAKPRTNFPLCNHLMAKHESAPVRDVVGRVNAILADGY